MIMMAMTTAVGLSRRYKAEVRTRPPINLLVCQDAHLQFTFFRMAYPTFFSSSLTTVLGVVKVTEEVASHLLDWVRTFS
jgi:hypothetical protein